MNLMREGFLFLYLEPSIFDVYVYEKIFRQLRRKVPGHWLAIRVITIDISLLLCNVEKKILFFYHSSVVLRFAIVAEFNVCLMILTFATFTDGVIMTLAFR